jgi:hypothetical protein
MINLFLFLDLTDWSKEVFAQARKITDLHRKDWMDIVIPEILPATATMELHSSTVLHQAEGDTTRRVQNIILAAVNVARLQLPTLISGFGNEQTEDSQIVSTALAKADCVLKVSFVHVLRDEDKSAKVSIDVAVHQLASNTRPWSAVLYGDMPSAVYLAASVCKM